MLSQGNVPTESGIGKGFVRLGDSRLVYANIGWKRQSLFQAIAVRLPYSAGSRQFATPLSGIYAGPDGPMKAGVRPVRDAGDPSMLQWVEVNIVNVMPVIALITNQMLPITPLPDPSLATGSLRCRQHLGFWQPPSKRELDDLPAQRKICIVVG